MFFFGNPLESGGFMSRRIRVGVYFLSEQDFILKCEHEDIDYINFTTEDEELPKELDFLMTDSGKLIESMYEGELIFDGHPKVLAFCINSFIRSTWMKFLSINGVATFVDFELSKDQTDRLLLLFRDQVSVHLNDYLQDRDQPLLDFKISNWGNAGYIFDLICLHAASNEVDVKALRVYLELMMIYFLTIKKKGEEVLPIEMQVSSKNNTFYLLLSFNAKEDFFHDFFKDVYTSNQDEIVKNWLYYLPTLVTSLEVNYVKNLEKVSFVSTWNEDSDFDYGNEGHVIFNVIAQHRPWLQLEGSFSPEELDEEALIEKLEDQIAQTDIYEKKKELAKTFFSSNKDSEFFKDKKLLTKMTDHCHNEVIKTSSPDQEPVDKERIKGILLQNKDQTMVAGFKDDDLDLLATRVNNFDETKKIEEHLVTIQGNPNAQAEVDEIVKIKSQTSLVEEIVQRLPSDEIEEDEAITRVKALKEKMEEIVKISGGNSETDQFAKDFVKNIGQKVQSEKNWNVAVSSALHQAIEDNDLMKVIGSPDEKELVRVISAGTGIAQDEVQMVVKNLAERKQVIEDEIWVEKVIDLKKIDDSKDDLTIVKSLLDSVSTGDSINASQMKIFENILKKQTAMIEEAQLEKRKYIKLKHMLVVEAHQSGQKLKHSEVEIKQKDSQLQALRTNLANLTNNKDREIFSLQNQIDHLQASRLAGTGTGAVKKEPEETSRQNDLANQIFKIKQEKERLGIELTKSRAQEQTLRQEVKALKKYKEAFEAKSKEDADEFIKENQKKGQDAGVRDVAAFADENQQRKIAELQKEVVDSQNQIMNLKQEKGRMNIEITKARVLEQNLRQEMKSLKKGRELLEVATRDSMHELAKEAERTQGQENKVQDMFSQERLQSQQRYAEVKKELLAAQAELKIKDAQLKKSQDKNAEPADAEAGGDKTVAISKYNQLNISHKKITSDFKKSVAELASSAQLVEW
jgi:hypothetical protein